LILKLINEQAEWDGNRDEALAMRAFIEKRI